MPTDSTPVGCVCYLPGVRSELLGKVSRIVVKLGTGVVTDSRKRPDQVQLAQLVAQVAGLRATGREVVIVTSGAVGAGMGVLGYDERPAALAERQACAAVGQSRLMSTYEALFRHYDLSVGQVLLTHEDLADHTRHLNARNTLITLLKRGVVPIINENDAVSVTELKFGDNDRLSALVASLLPADLLVILTTADGLIQNFDRPGAKLLSVVPRIDAGIEAMAGGTSSGTAVGGMATKITAAKIVVRAGIPLVIASGRKFDALEKILAGSDEGTVFLPNPTKLPSRKRWIAFYHRPAGAVVIDAGAQRALCEQGRSLLAPGIVTVEGEFGPGDVVSIRDVEGGEVARGLTRVASSALPGSPVGRLEVVHRDDLVIL